MFDPGAIDDVTQQYMYAFSLHSFAIKHAAKSLFYSLAVIQLTITTLLMVISGESLQRFFSKLVQLAMILGFFYLLIDKGNVWIPSLVRGFVQLGEQAGAAALTPSGVIDQGNKLFMTLFKMVYELGVIKHPFITLMSVALGVGLIIIFAFIAAELAIVLVKSYLIIMLSHLFFAFGAFEVTRQMSMNYFKAAIGIGLKLMALYIMMSIGADLSYHWLKMMESAAQNQEITPVFSVFGSLIIYYLLLKNIPPWIAGFSGIGGFRNYGDAAIGSAITAGFTASNSVLKAAEIAKHGVHGSAQFGSGAVNSIKSGWHGFRQSDGGIPKSIYAGATNTLSSVANASFNATTDAFMKRNTNMSFGQKFNYHIGNKLNSNFVKKPD